MIGYLEKNQIVLPDDATTADAVRRVDREVHDGADAIKIFAGSVEGDGVTLMPLERPQGIVAEAHRLHRLVFVHPSNIAGINIAFDSHADLLAHVTFDHPWSPELVRRLRAAKMTLIPTLTLFDVEATNAGATPARVEAFVDRAVACLRAYNSAGGDILFGTDVGYIYRFDTAEEYTLMQRAGMSFAQILASLTTNPAERFAFAAHSGRLAPGLDADLTVVRGDPAAHIDTLAHVAYTIRSGRIIYQAISR